MGLISSHCTFTSDLNVVPNYSIENIGTKAIVPGSVTVDTYIDYISTNQADYADNGLITYETPLQGNIRLRYGMVHYGLGIINYIGGAYDPSVGHTQEYNFATVDLISGDNLSFLGGAATIQLPQNESIKPGSVRFIANLDVTRSSSF